MSGEAKRPRRLTVMLLLTQLAALITAVTRWLGYEAALHDRYLGFLADPLLVEGALLGVALFAAASLSYRPSRGSHRILLGLYLLAVLDALLWGLLSLVWVLSAGMDDSALIGWGRLVWIVPKIVVSVMAMATLRSDAVTEWVDYRPSNAPIRF